MAMSALIIALAPSPSPTGGASEFLNRPEAFWTGWAAIGTILGAVATFAAVVVSLVAVKHQRDRENDLQKTEADRQKRAQADYVAAWYDDESDCIIVVNQSAQAIYDAYAVLVRHTSDGDGHSPDYAGMLRVVPPGQKGAVPIQEGWRGMSFRPGTTLTFRDSQGITWQRTNRGHLKELDTDVFEHYGLSQPATYVG
jgi:hypothetical protein